MPRRRGRVVCLRIVYLQAVDGIGNALEGGIALYRLLILKLLLFDVLLRRILLTLTHAAGQKTPQLRTGREDLLVVLTNSYVRRYGPQKLIPNGTGYQPPVPPILQGVQNGGERHGRGIDLHEGRIADRQLGYVP